MLIGIDGNEANVQQRVGANVYAYHILNFLHKKSQSGEEANLQCRVYLKDKPVLDLPGENDNWQYQVFGPKFLWTQWRLPLQLLIEREKPDIFFTPGHYAPRFSPIPRVISIMDLAFLKYPQDFRGKDLTQLKSWTKYSVKNAAHIFAISGATKKDIIDFYKVDPDKITVTYPGIYREKLKTPNSRLEKKKIRDKYKISRDYLLFIGTLQPRKNLVRLIEAFFLLKTNISLVVIGKKGWLYDQIFAKVKQMKLQNRVKFLGFVTDEEIPLLLLGAKAYVLPSLYEGFGIPVVEAMACGVPVVVSNVSSLPEIAGEAGIYIEDPNSVGSIKNSLEKMLKLRDEERKKLVARGRKLAQRFSWDQCGAKTWQTIKKLVREKDV